MELIKLNKTDVNVRKATTLGHKLSDILSRIRSEVVQEELIAELRQLVSKAERIARGS